MGRVRDTPFDVCAIFGDIAVVVRPSVADDANDSRAFRSTLPRSFVTTDIFASLATSGRQASSSLLSTTAAVCTCPIDRETFLIPPLMSYKLAFHDADTDTDFLANILARIVARMSVSVSVSASWSSSLYPTRGYDGAAPGLHSCLESSS